MIRTSARLAVLLSLPLLFACTGADPVATVEEDVRACDGRRVDVLSDHNNCGRCGQACGPKETCDAGHCAETGGGAAGAGKGARCRGGEKACGSFCCPGGTTCGTGVGGEPVCRGLATGGCREGEQLCTVTGTATPAQGCCPEGTTCAGIQQGAGNATATCVAGFSDPATGVCPGDEISCGAFCCAAGGTCGTAVLGGTPIRVCM